MLKWSCVPVYVRSCPIDHRLPSITAKDVVESAGFIGFHGLRYYLER